MPLVRRVPKRGFTNIFGTEYTPVNLDRVDKIGKEEVKIKDLVDFGLVRRESERVKVLGRGDLSSSKIIHAHRFSQTALKKIEETGGKAITIGKD